MALVPAQFVDLLARLVVDEDEEVARLAIRSARVIAREELVGPLMVALGASVPCRRSGRSARQAGAWHHPRTRRHSCSDESTDVEVRRELPTRARSNRHARGRASARRAACLNADTTLRHRVIASLNKLRAIHPDVRIDPGTIEILLAAEIAGHYRSYQVLGPLRGQLKESDPVLQALRHAMEQELERVFRLMALLYPEGGLHDAYVGLRAANPIVRANALEFLDNVLQPELRQVLVPLLDAQVTDRRAHRDRESRRWCARGDDRSGARRRCWRAKTRGCARVRSTRSAPCRFAASKTS